MKGDIAKVTKLLQEKKGQTGMLAAAPAAVIVLVIIAVILGVGSTVLDKVDDTQTTNSFAYNATQDGLKGLDTFSDFQPTMATIVVAVVIIGLLLGGFAFVRGKRGG